MLYDLFFNNRYDENIFITSCKQEDIILKIKQYIHKINPNYKIYYIRSWEDDTRIWYDVGSHSEFFYIKKGLK